MLSCRTRPSQAVVDLLPISEGDRVLDYCAGGGGKVLAMAARVEARYFAHDANPKRMQDLGARAERARALYFGIAIRGGGRVWAIRFGAV